MLETARVANPRKSVEDHAFDVAVRAYENVSGACGMSAVDDEAVDDNGRMYHQWELVKPGQDFRQLACGKLMLTNCTLSYSELKCPESCPYLAPNEDFPCQFECVKDDKCWMANPNRAYANPLTKLCEKCSKGLVGCKICSSPTTCGECYPGGFELTSDAMCEFVLDKGGVFARILLVAGVLVTLLLITMACYCILGSQSPYHHSNYNAILQGRRQRHLSKVQKWNLEDPRHPREMYDLAINTFRQDILGVGLPLFYSTIIFLGCMAAFFLGTYYYLYTTSDLEIVLPVVDVNYAALATSPHALNGALPAKLISPMQRCHEKSPLESQEILRGFATSNFYALCCLYVALFYFSWRHGRQQLRKVSEFDASSLTMSDFVLQLEGLPRDATDEVALKKWLEEEFARFNVEVDGISIAYDYHHVAEDVRSMLNRSQKMTELLLEVRGPGEEKTDGSILAVQEYSRTITRGSLERQIQEDAVKVKEWFQPNSSNRLKSTGKAFVIFKSPKHKETAHNYYLDHQNFLHHPQVADRPIVIHQVRSEPPDALWENLHRTDAEIQTSQWRKLVWIFCFFIVANLLTTVPWNRYVVYPYAQAGTAAGGPKTMIAGIILGVVGAQIGGQVWSAASSIGFHRKDRADSFLLVVETILSILNTFLALSLTAITVLGSKGNDSSVAEKSFQIFEPLWSSRSQGSENALVGSIYLMLVPGQFFVNNIMGLLVGCIVPYLQAAFIQKCIYVWRCLPVKLLQVLKVLLPFAPDSLDRYDSESAECALKAPQIGLAFDYCAFIVNAMICFSMLFFFSPYVWRIFLAWTIWAGFYFYFCRYMHLRVQSASFYSTGRLDTLAMILWGLPMGVVAAAAVCWSFRADMFLTGFPWETKALMCFLAAVASFALWVTVYLKTLKPFDQKDGKERRENASPREAWTRWVFSWYNTNPVYVLKSIYVILPSVEKVEGEIRGPFPSYSRGWANPLPTAHKKESHAIYYTVGKEYLFMDEENARYSMERLADPMEFETWIEHTLNTIGSLREFCRCMRENTHHIKDRFVPMMYTEDDGAEAAQSLLESTPMKSAMGSSPGATSNRTVSPER
jgi:hypothetical protein